MDMEENICDPEEGRFNVWNQTFTDGDPRKTAMFHSFFHMSLKLLNLITRGGTPQPLGSYALCQGLIVFLSIYLWLKHEIFTVTVMSSRTWEIGPFRVITQQYASSFKSQHIENTRANVFLAGCPNIPFSVPFYNGFTMTTGFPLIRLVRSQNSKFFLKRPRSSRFVNSHGRHLTASGPSS